MKTLLIGCLGLLVTCPVRASSSDFPTEAELKTRLHPGMTRREVIARLGEPATENRERRNSYFFRYFPSVQLLTNDQEGYMGFEVHLVDDKVRDWRAIRGRPSYAPTQIPRASRWSNTIWLLVVGCTAFYGMMRAFNRQMSEEQALQKAYRDRDIPTRQLPGEFRFITHDTTIQEVIDKLGPYSLLGQHAVSQRFAENFQSSDGPLGYPAIVSFNYDLPYHAAVLLLPEYPFKPENRIRAAYYRPARMDDET